MARIWNNKNIDFLKKNYAKSTTQEIADRLGSTSMSVQTMASNLGLKKTKRWTDADKAELRARIEKGETFSDIAKAMGSTVDSVSKHAQMFGFRINQSYSNPSMGKYIRSHYKTASNFELAEHCKVPVSAVKSFLHRNGLKRSS